MTPAQLFLMNRVEGRWANAKPDRQEGSLTDLLSLSRLRTG